MLGQGHLNTPRCLNRQHSNNVCQERYSKRMVRTRDPKETYVGGNKTKTKEKQNIKKNKENLFWYCIELYVYVVLLLSKTQNKKQNRKSKVNILIISNILTKKHLVITKTCRFHPASKQPNLKRYCVVALTYAQIRLFTIVLTMLWEIYRRAILVKI